MRSLTSAGKIQFASQLLRQENPRVPLYASEPLSSNLLSKSNFTIEKIVNHQIGDKNEHYRAWAPRLLGFVLIFKQKFGTINLMRNSHY